MDPEGTLSPPVGAAVHVVGCRCWCACVVAIWHKRKMQCHPVRQGLLWLLWLWRTIWRVTAGATAALPWAWQCVLAVVTARPMLTSCW